MTLQIGQFNTTCYVPPECRRDAEMVDHLARGCFARDLGECLGPTLARQPAILRIKLLPMRVLLPASELNEDALSLRWRREFTKTLFTALAYPAGVGPFEVYRSNSVAGFIASAIHDLLDGTAIDKWQYAEFETFFRLGSTQASLAIICEWPQHSLEVLSNLAAQNILSRLSARFDNSAFDRIFAILAPSTEAETRVLSIEDLIAAARLALDHPPEKALALRSPAYALTLFVEAYRANQSTSSARSLFHCLLALSVLLNEETCWPGRPQSEPRSGYLPSNVTGILQSIADSIATQLDRQPLTGESQSEGRAGDYSLSTSQAILQAIGGALYHHVHTNLRSDARHSLHRTFEQTSSASQQTNGPSVSSQLAELDRLLQMLREVLKVPTPSAKPPEARWVSSEWCGLFFLAGTLNRLGWLPAWRQLPDFQAGGVGCLLIGIALSIQGRFDVAVPSLDAASTLFSGYLHDPDLLHARKVFQSFPQATRLRVLHAALPQESVEASAASWQTTFDRLAETLLRAFASRVRGFRQATRQGIVRTFLSRAGRIRIESDRLVIYPVASPFNVALHLSGVDDPVESSIALGGIRIEFELGDL